MTIPADHMEGLKPIQGVDIWLERVKEGLAKYGLPATLDPDNERLARIHYRSGESLDDSVMTISMRIRGDMARARPMPKPPLFRGRSYYRSFGDWWRAELMPAVELAILLALFIALVISAVREWLS